MLSLLPIASTTTMGSPLLLLANPDNLQHFIPVKLLKAYRSNDLLMVLLSVEKASLLESLTVKVMSVLENLADGVNGNVLGKDVFTFSFNRLNVVSVSQLFKYTIIRIKDYEILTDSKS